MTAERRGDRRTGRVRGVLVDRRQRFGGAIDDEDGFAVSSSIAASDSVAPLMTVGASLTAVTLSLSATVPVLYCVVPPVAPTPLRSTVPPLVTGPLESSIRWLVSAGVVPFQFAVGRKRSSALVSSTSAEALETEPTSVHVVPSVEY